MNEPTENPQNPTETGNPSKEEKTHVRDKSLTLAICRFLNTKAGLGVLAIVGTSIIVPVFSYINEINKWQRQSSYDAFQQKVQFWRSIIVDLTFVEAESYDIANVAERVFEDKNMSEIEFKQILVELETKKNSLMRQRMIILGKIRGTECDSDIIEHLEKQTDFFDSYVNFTKQMVNFHQHHINAGNKWTRLEKSMNGLQNSKGLSEIKSQVSKAKKLIAKEDSAHKAFLAKLQAVSAYIQSDISLSKVEIQLAKANYFSESSIFPRHYRWSKEKNRTIWATSRNLVRQRQLTLCI